MLLRFLIAKLLKKARLSSLKKSNIHFSSKVESGSSVYFSTIDRYSFCGYDCELFHVDIGSFTSIANRVIIGGARHPMEWVAMSPVFYKGRDSLSKKFSEHQLDDDMRTSIGHDVWIGQSSIILSGVKVGNGAVIGAGSLVTKDVPPYAVVAGNPAILIRYRFEEDVISDLERIKWWELSDEILSKMSKYIPSPKKFISTYYSLKL